MPKTVTTSLPPIRTGMAHRSPKHPLVKWRRTRGMSGPKFIAALRPHLPKGYALTASTLSRIENGQVKAVRLEFIAAVGKVTGGAVGLDAFMG